MNTLHRPLGTLLVCVFLAIAVRPARAQVLLPDQFVDQLVATGLNEPTGLAFLPDQRLIVVERSGAVRLIADGKLGGVDPMVVVDSVDATGDRGMTGVAIDPRWPMKPYIYVYYDRLDGTCRITRYTAGGDLTGPNSLYLYLDAASKYDVIADIPDLQSVHNGGTLRFGADSMMYAALGEDGFACAAQDTSSLRGVMIRIDVRGLPPGPGGPPDKNLLVPPDNPLVAMPVMNARLVWAIGLRNPFRFHIDPVSHNIFIADVGWNLFEEVDILSAPMQNFGWPFFEGPAEYVSSCPGIITSPNLRSPIFAYDRTGFTSAIVSGGVYRSAPCLTCNFPPEYEGDFFFSDFYEGFLRRIKFDGTNWNLAPPVAGQPTGQDWGLGFGEVADYLVGKDGAMWYAKMGYDFMPQTGEVHRIYHDQPLGGVDGAVRPSVTFAAPRPTPSYGNVELNYSLSQADQVELKVFDSHGRLVRSLLSRGEQMAGPHHVQWDGRDDGGKPVPAGIYLTRLMTGRARMARRIVIVR